MEIFRDITTAYEVLSDAESRKDYDEALLHPERFFQNQMRYYQHQYRHAQQVDAWKVLLLTLILVSLAHFYYWRHRHAKVIQMIAAAPLVVQRMRAKVKTDILEAKAKAGMKNPSASKEEIDAAVQLEDVRNYAELTSWEGRAPTLWDTVPVWLAVAPFRLAKFLYWHARFLTLFTILGREYGPEEADYATCVALGMDYNKSVAEGTRRPEGRCRERVGSAVAREQSTPPCGRSVLMLLLVFCVLFLSSLLSLRSVFLRSASPPVHSVACPLLPPCNPSLLPFVPLQMELRRSRR